MRLTKHQFKQKINKKRRTHIMRASRRIKQHLHQSIELWNNLNADGERESGKRRIAQNELYSTNKNGERCSIIWIFPAQFSVRFCIASNSSTAFSGYHIRFFRWNNFHHAFWPCHTQKHQKHSHTHTHTTINWYMIQKIKYR